MPFSCPTFGRAFIKDLSAFERAHPSPSISYFLFSFLCSTSPLLFVFVVDETHSDEKRGSLRGRGETPQGAGS